LSNSWSETKHNYDEKPSYCLRSITGGVDRAMVPVTKQLNF